MCVRPTRNRCSDWRSSRRKKPARTRCLVLYRSWLWRRLGEDEGCFAGPRQLQLLANLHLLLATALFQTKDALFALLVLVRQRDVALLKPADLAALLKQGLETLRTEEERHSIARHQRYRQNGSNAPAGAVEEGLQRQPQSMVIAWNGENIQSHDIFSLELDGRWNVRGTATRSD